MSRGISCTLAFFAIVFISSAKSSTSSATPDTDTSLETCLRKDSISCVQIHIYKKLRALFSKDTIDLLAGFQLVKDHQDARSMDVDNEIFGGKSVFDRQSALEDYIYNQLANFFQQRRFSWDVKPAVEQLTSAARMAMDNVPKDVKDNLDSDMSEGRGKKKKILKSLIPVIVAAIVKKIILLKVAIIAIIIIAKKALILSAISLAISIFLAIKKLMHKKHHHGEHYEVHGEAYHGSAHHPISSSGWSNSGWNNGWDMYDSHGSHSQPSSHHMAYSAQKPTLR